MKKVLVAVDGSPVSEKVFDHALKRAINLDYQLTFLQVIPTPEYGGDLAEKGLENETETAEEMVEEFTEKANQQGGKANRDVIKGTNISNAIVKYAVENDFDLIIIGGSGKSDLGTIHLGNVAEGVVKRAHCSVLVVH